MTYQEMMSKTGCKVVGFVRSLVSYQGKDKLFWSVDVDVKGCRMPINIRLSDGYDRSKLIEGTIVEVSVVPRLNFARNGLELHAA